MAVEVDIAVLRLRSIRGGNRGGAGLADDLAWARREVPGDGHTIGWAEADDLEPDFHVSFGADRISTNRIGHHVWGHLHFVGSLAPGAAQLFGLRIDTRADILAMIIRVEDHDAYAIPIASIGLDGKVERADHHLLFFRLPVVSGGFR